MFVCVYVINDLAFIYIHANTIIVFATDHSTTKASVLAVVVEQVRFH